MKEIMKLGAILFIITATAGFLLGMAHEVTKGPIAKQQESTREKAMRETFKEAETFRTLDVVIPDQSIINEINAGYVGDELKGFAVKVSPKGFSGPIEMMVGITKEGKIEGIKILKHGETPGLGANAKEAKFSDQYKEKSSVLAVIKTPTEADTEITAITGATITSKAVTRGVNEVFKLVESRDENIDSIDFQFGEGK